MGLLDYFSPSKAVVDDQKLPQNVEAQTIEKHSPAPKDIPLPLSPMTSTTEITVTAVKQPPRRFSFKPKPLTAQPHHHDEDPKHALSAIQEKEKRQHAAQALSKRLISSNSDKRAQHSADDIRRLIVGPTFASPKVSPVVAKPQMSDKLKSQLMKPKSANKIISHLRQLSPDPGNTQPNGPIHAVCLSRTEDEMHEQHFSKLVAPEQDNAVSFSIMNNAPVEALTSMLNEMHVVDLVKSPDFGIGQPGDGDGILAGAIPTAETVINGIEQITPQLMALGYATGRAILPDHTGIHPPTDRMSVLTYWWGFEIVFPPPTMVYLANAQSISGQVVNFLSALALVNNGVREILPFVRYISQFIDFEFKNIQAQNRGKGVVCAATWLVPAALVPRSWDFTPPEPKPAAPQPPDTSSEGELDKPVETNTPVYVKPSETVSGSPLTSTGPSGSIAMTPSIPAVLVGATTPTVSSS
ncbi:hypothetical protein GYMLUDRAFT_37565 [Collybiopsis luxurians FD-317 M1]|nr:hypothetical protein GYMLUDRAFT_37565 [Collybiopsis luxurians FD-317 M1]